jgi:hypothetical protein
VFSAVWFHQQEQAMAVEQLKRLLGRLGFGLYGPISQWHLAVPHFRVAVP